MTPDCRGRAALAAVPGVAWLGPGRCEGRGAPGGPGGARAGPAAPRARPRRAPRRGAWLGGRPAGVRRLEFVEMFSAVAGGSRMGPGDGWFHPGQSRYDWAWLAGRFDANRDGRITRDEFRGPAEWF